MRGHGVIGVALLLGCACGKRDDPPVEVLRGPPVSLRPHVPRDGDRIEVEKWSERVTRDVSAEPGVTTINRTRFTARERFEDRYRGAAGSPSRKVERRWEERSSDLDPETVAKLDGWWRLDGFLPAEPVRLGARWHVARAPSPPAHAATVAIDPSQIVRSYGNGHFARVGKADGRRVALLDVQFVYVLEGGRQREFRGTAEFDCQAHVVTAVRLRERAETVTTWNVRATLHPAGAD